MKGQDIAILAGVGIIGFGLLKSDFFQGVGKVGTGVGDAVGGLGSGVGYAGQAAGYNLADIFNAFGQAGQSSQTLIREVGEHTTNTITELGTDLTEATDLTGDVVVDASGILSDASGSLRSVNKGFWNAFDTTWNLDNPDNIFTNSAAGIASAGSTAINKGSSVFDWVKKQVSPLKSLRLPSITGAVIGSGSGSSSPQSAAGSSGGSSSSSSIRSPTRNTFLESIGYEGTSTATGITYTKPAPTFLGKPIVSTPTRSIRKPWYKFW